MLSFVAFPQTLNHSASWIAAVESADFYSVRYTPMYEQRIHSHMFHMLFTTINLSGTGHNHSCVAILNSR